MRQAKIFNAIGILLITMMLGILFGILAEKYDINHVVIALCCGSIGFFMPIFLVRWLNIIVTPSSENVKSEDISKD